MKKSLTYQILDAHLLSGDLKAGAEIMVKVDQTLTQDSTGTMVYLQLEAMGIDKIQTELSVAYIDHNTLQSGFENADDHAFIRSAARKYGLVFSKPGGGICHQVHLERFAKPGKILIGSDSHTPTCGGVGSLAIGAGGLDVAVGMAQGTYHLTVPRVINIRLHGALQPYVNGKDVILDILRRLTVKGGVGAVIEYSGPGITTLSVTDRATICNMGAELGATASLFPSDAQTERYLTQQGRPEDYQPLAADPDAVYDEVLDLDLSQIVPLAACPHSPDKIKPVAELGDVRIQQVCIGSCTNSSYSDMMKAAAILAGQTVHPQVSLAISPGSSNILRLLAANGALRDLIAAGARILESACGPCIGMGQSPGSGEVSLRTFNRNFKGRSGTSDAEVYLVSPETAAISAIHGRITDPRSAGDALVIEEPESFGRSDAYFIWPDPEGLGEAVVMGPNIKPFPNGEALPETLEKYVLLKTGDNVTTDDIVPSHAKLLPYRSNIPHLANYAFGTLTSGFKERAFDRQGGFIIGGDNYGQGSSREHAALVPLYLGVRAVIARSFARIHQANLINAGILPLTFVDPADYDRISEGDLLLLGPTGQGFEDGRMQLTNKTTGLTHLLNCSFTPRQTAILQAGGFLNFSRNAPTP